jgi:hypothetical protein
LDPSLFTHWGWRAIGWDGYSCLKNDDDDDDNSDDDDVSDDNDGAANNAGEESMPDDMTVAPNMNTPLGAVSGIVGAVGGAKGNGERSCAAG